MVSSAKRSAPSSPIDEENLGVARPQSGSPTSAGSGVAAARRPRRVYEASFKIMVVREALKLPPSNRIKPTCRAFPGVEPVQVRKWIRNLSALKQAQPTAKLVQKRALPSPPALACDESSDETEIMSMTSQPNAYSYLGGMTPAAELDSESLRVARELLSLSATFAH